MRSMTGFGQAEWRGDGVRLSVEVRGVNHRYLDVRVSLPRECQSWEPELRPLVAAAVQRGKVDVSVVRSGAPQAGRRVEVDEEAAREVVRGWRRLQKALKLPGEVDMALLQARGDLVRVVERPRDAAADLPRVKTLVEKALRSFEKARVGEGKALQKDMKQRCVRLAHIETELRRRSAEIVPLLAERLRKRLEKLAGDRVDEQRLLQETAIIAERCDVTEELVRLSTHLKRLAALLREKDAVGKPIDFLLQEIHRELNTIAAKSSDVEVTRLSLEGRAEVEKLREQTQNIE